jgi:hypothetical protein
MHRLDTWRVQRFRSRVHPGKSRVLTGISVCNRAPAGLKLERTWEPVVALLPWSRSQLLAPGRFAVGAYGFADMDF